MKLKELLDAFQDCIERYEGTVPCRHEDLNTKLGNGQIWAKCNDCGSTLQRDTDYLPRLRERIDKQEARIAEYRQILGDCRKETVMPCYYTGTAEGDAKLDAAETRRKLTKTTRLLCKAMELLLRSFDTPAIPQELLRWHSKHQKVDKKTKPKAVWLKSTKISEDVHELNGWAWQLPSGKVAENSFFAGLKPKMPWARKGKWVEAKAHVTELK